MEASQRFNRVPISKLIQDQDPVPGVFYKACVVPSTENKKGHAVVRIKFTIEGLPELKEALAAGTATLDELSQKKQDIISMMVAYYSYETDEVRPPGTPKSMFETNRRANRKKFERDTILVISELAGEERKLRAKLGIPEKKSKWDGTTMLAKVTENEEEHLEAEEAGKAEKQDLEEAIRKIAEQTHVGEVLNGDEHSLVKEAGKTQEHAPEKEKRERGKQTAAEEPGEKQEQIAAEETRKEEEKVLAEKGMKREEESVEGEMGQREEKTPEEETGKGEDDAVGETGQKEEETPDRETGKRRQDEAKEGATSSEEQTSSKETMKGEEQPIDEQKSKWWKIRIWGNRQ